MAACAASMKLLSWTRKILHASSKSLARAAFSLGNLPYDVVGV
jgi:hypothetical protein